MSNYKIKRIVENKEITSENKQEKQIEVTFESAGKTDKILLSGSGSLKISTPV